MVQVDVFWSYGIGAGIALAHAAQIQSSYHRYVQQRGAVPGPRVMLHEASFRDTLLFLSTCFAPSGMFLLAAFPHWETMHVATTFADLPPWLVTLFAITNITQGILGYKITEALLRRGASYAAYLQWLGGYFAMFFILVHGWDGTGYVRFFSAHPDWIEGWTWSVAASWFVSDVGLSLGAIGVVFVPWLLALMVRPLRQHHSWSVPGLVASILSMNVVVAPLMAIGASLSLRALGPVGGTVAFLVVAWALCLRRGGLLHRHCEHLLGPAVAAVSDPAQPAMASARG